jgi:hypothetical protein
VRRCDTELADKIRAQMRLIEQSARDQATGRLDFGATPH